MSDVAEKLKGELLSLPPEDRIELANFLYRSVPTDEDEDFLAELERRRADYESGKSPGIPAEEFFHYTDS